MDGKDSPDYFIVDTKIVVNEHMPGPDYFHPLDLWMCLPKVSRNPVGGFAQYLYITYDGIVRTSVANKLLERIASGK